MTTTVVNAKDVLEWTGQHVYIGRGGWAGRKRLAPSKWGNHLKVGRDGTREEVVAKHRRDLMDMRHHANSGHFETRLMLLELRALRGKILVCHCAPLACHGTVLAEIADADGRVP